MWNQRDKVLACLLRSSNLAEGWHNGFRCLMNYSNPTIWRFIDVLKKERDLTDWKINQKMMRQPPPSQQKKWKDYDRQFNSIIMSDDDFQRMDYLKCVGSMVPYLYNIMYSQWHNVTIWWPLLIFCRPPQKFYCLQTKEQKIGRHFFFGFSYRLLVPPLELFVPPNIFFASTGR